MRLWILPALFVICCLLSVVTLSSIAPSLAPRQLVFFLIGAGLVWRISRISFLSLQRLYLPAYSIVLLLLLLTMAVGFTTRNTISWIPIGPWFAFQPSQLAIPFIGLFAAHFAAHNDMSKLANLLTLITAIGLPAGLILIQPDLGTALIFLGSLSVLIFLSNTQWKHLFALAGIAIVFLVIGWNFIFKPYQKARITSFISPDASAAESYNARQSLIAVGSGQVMGRGLGQGIQSHLQFLPERQTDFIFASIAEEYGFVGSSIVLSIYFVLAIYCLYIGIQAVHPSAKLFCYTTAAFIFFQSGVNIGMNIGIFPITGITLPLLSAGGSSVLAVSINLGIIQSIAREPRKKLRLNIT